MKKAFRGAMPSSMAICCRHWNRAAGATTGLSGDGWIAVGDAGGLVDPITGEGLYYAIRSGDLASQVLLNDFEPGKNAEAYRQIITRDFGLDLTYGVGLAKRLFLRRDLFRRGAQPHD